MSELPRGWIQSTLGEVAQIRAGSAFPPHWQGRTDGDVPFVKVSDISATVNASSVELKTAAQRLPRSDLDAIRAKIAPPGSVIFAKIGEGVRLNRRVITAVETAFDNNVVGLVPHPAAIEGRLLLHYMRTVSLYDYATATTVPAVRSSTIAALPIPLPPLNEQRRLVIRLEGLESRGRRARDALNEVPALLEKLRQSILAAAFRGDLTKDWRAKNPDVEPAKKLLQRIRAERRKKWEEAELAKMQAKGNLPENDMWKARYAEPVSVEASPELPNLPNSWTWATMEELCDAHRTIVYGIIKAGPHFPGGVPYVRVTEVVSGALNVSTLPRCDPARANQFTRSTLRAGDILVSKDGTIGSVAIVPPELEGANINQHVLRVAPSALVETAFLARVIEAPHSQRWMQGEVKGIALRGVNVEDFRRMPVPLAPLTEQQAAAARVTTLLANLESVTDCFSTASDDLGNLQQAVLAKAFRGELVPQDPSDEPAEAMLARLRSPAPASTGSPTSSPQSSKRKSRPRKP